MRIHKLVSFAARFGAAGDDGAAGALLHVRGVPEAGDGRGDGLLRGGRAARGRHGQARKGQNNQDC